MNTRRILLSISLTVFCTGVGVAVTIQDATVTNQWSQPVQRFLESPIGTVGARVQNYRYDARFQDGSVSPKLQEMVFVPESGLVWVGSPCEQYFVFGNAIVGIRPSSLGAIMINRQQTKIQGTTAEQQEKIKEHGQKVAERVKAAGVNGTFDGVEAISLAELIGRDPFQDMRSARGSEPPKLTGVRFNGDEVTIELTGGDGAKVSVTFDSAMRVVRVSVAGETLYPKTK